MQTLIENLDKKEILRYLGHHGHDYPEKLDRLIDECIHTALQIITPKYLYRRFHITKSPDAIAVDGTPVVLTGKDILNHLSMSNEIFLLCATVGLQIDREIRTRMITSPDEGVILDSCATAAVEQTADLAEQEIISICKAENKGTTWRFSAGYGDLPLEIQKDIISVMDSYRKIGLTLTDSLLMTPSKSVTAIIGVTDTADTKKERRSKCDNCKAKENCMVKHLKVVQDLRGHFSL